MTDKEVIVFIYYFLLGYFFTVSFIVWHFVECNEVLCCIGECYNIINEDGQ